MTLEFLWFSPFVLLNSLIPRFFRVIFKVSSSKANSIERDIAISVTRDGRFRSYLARGGPGWLLSRIEEDKRRWLCGIFFSLPLEFSFLYLWLLFGVFMLCFFMDVCSILCFDFSINIIPDGKKKIEWTKLNSMWLMLILSGINIELYDGAKNLIELDSNVNVEWANKKVLILSSYKHIRSKSKTYLSINECPRSPVHMVI